MEDVDVIKSPARETESTYKAHGHEGSFLCWDTTIPTLDSCNFIIIIFILIKMDDKRLLSGNVFI